MSQEMAQKYKELKRLFCEQLPPSLPPHLRSWWLEKAESAPFTSDVCLRLLASDLSDRLYQELCGLKGIGPKRAEAFLMRAHCSVETLIFWPNNLRLIMQDPKIWLNRLKELDDQKRTSNLEAVMWSSRKTHFPRETIQAVRNWAKPWYQGDHL